MGLQTVNLFYILVMWNFSKKKGDIFCVTSFVVIAIIWYNSEWCHKSLLGRFYPCGTLSAFLHTCELHVLSRFGACLSWHCILCHSVRLHRFATFALSQCRRSIVCHRCHWYSWKVSVRHFLYRLRNIHIHRNLSYSLWI